MADPTEAEETDTEGQAPKQNWRRALEDRAEQAEGRADQAEGRVAELERRLALSDAGLGGLSEKQTKALLAAHDGEISAELLKATATELGFATQAAAGETISGADEGSEPALDPALASEAQVLASLSNSPATHVTSSQGRMTQAQFDEKVRSFTSERELDAFLRENIHLLPNGQ